MLKPDYSSGKCKYMPTFHCALKENSAYAKLLLGVSLIQEWCNCLLASTVYEQSTRELCWN